MAGGRRHADTLQYATANCESQTCGNTKSNDPHYSRFNTSTTAEPVQELPDAISWLTQRVKRDGWPEAQATPAKKQPWRDVWGGPQVSKDGRLIIACPKGYEWGSGSGLGGY